MKKLYFFIAMFLFPLLANAQWETTDISGFGTTPKEATWMVKVGTQLVVAMSGSGIYVSTDNGENWAANNGGLAGTETIVHMMVKDNIIYFTTTSDIWKADGTVSPLAWTKVGSKGTATIPNSNLAQIAFIGSDIYLSTRGGGIAKNTLSTPGTLANATWTVLPHPKDSSTTADTKNIPALIEDNGKLLAGFDDDKTGLRIYTPGTPGTWSAPDTYLNSTTGLRLTGNTQADLLVRNDATGKFYPRLKYFFKDNDGVTIYAAIKRNLKDFNHKGIYKGVRDGSGNYTWTAFSTGLDNKEAANVLCFNKVGANIIAGTNNSGLAIWNGSNWSTTIKDVLKSNNIFTDGTNTFFCTNVGVYKYDGTNVTPKSTGLPLVTAITVNDMKYNAGTYYAATSNGVFTSTTGKGGWTRLVTNDMGQNVTSITFSGSSNIFASVNRRICKLNGQVWELVPALSSISFLNQLIAYTNGGHDYVFAVPAEYADAPIGIWRSDDGGTTWSEYFTLSGAYDTKTTRAPGLYNGTDNRFWTSKELRYNAATNTLVTGGRISASFTQDNGVTWYTRFPKSAYNNLTYLFLRDYKGTAYEFNGSQSDVSSARECMRSVVGDDIFDVATSVGINKTGQSEGVSMNEYGEGLLFFNQVSSIYKSEDNSDNWTLFETGLTGKAAAIGRGSYTFTAGDLMYFKGKDLSLQMYDLATAPTWTATYPNVTSIAQTTASVLVKNSRPGKAYYVVLPEADAAPTAAQVIAGTDASDVAATIKGNLVVSKDVEATLLITGLAVNTSYKVYSVVQSEVIKTTGLQAVSFSTLLTGLDNPKMVSSIYPIPAKGLLNVTMAMDANVSITSLVGARLISTHGKAGETLKIDVSQLQAGVYLVETTNGKNKRIEKITIK